jgi:hypothetical protein
VLLEMDRMEDAMGIWLTSSLGREIALRERMSVVVLERARADLVWLYMRARQN